MAAGPTYSAGGRRAQAAALQVSQVTFNGPRAAASARARGRPAAPCGRRGVGVAVAATNRGTVAHRMPEAGRRSRNSPHPTSSPMAAPITAPITTSPAIVHPGVHPGVADHAGEQAQRRRCQGQRLPHRIGEREARCGVPRRERRRVRHRHLAKGRHPRRVAVGPLPTRGELEADVDHGGVDGQRHQPRAGGAPALSATHRGHRHSDPEPQPRPVRGPRQPAHRHDRAPEWAFPPPPNRPRGRSARVRSAPRSPSSAPEPAPAAH